MREIRTSGSEGGGIETNRRSLPLSDNLALRLHDRGRRDKPGDDSFLLFKLTGTRSKSESERCRGDDAATQKMDHTACARERFPVNLDNKELSSPGLSRRPRS